MWDIEWEKKFLFSLNVFNEAECLVCNQKLKKKGAYYCKRHYDSSHSELSSLSEEDRDKLIRKLKKDMEFKNNRVLNNSCSNTTACSQMKATYIIALQLAKKGRPFGDGVFFKDMVLSILPCFGEAGKTVEAIINNMALSPSTIMRRTEDIGAFMNKEANDRIKNAKYLSVCFDESVDNSDTSQMIICLRTVDNAFNSFEEILRLDSFYGNVTGEILFNSFERNVLSVIDKNKLSAICTDGAAVMVGRTNGFVGQLIKAGIKVPTFHCIIHQQALFAKTIGLPATMKTALKIINRLKGGHNALTHRKLVAFLKDLDAEYNDVLMFTEVRWLSRGKCLERLFCLREEVATFFKSLALPKDTDLLNAITSSDFLLDLAFLSDITLQINNLNLVLQGKNKNICNLFFAVKDFCRKLEILGNQMEKQDLLNFPRTNEIYQKFPNQEKLRIYSEELKKLLDNFKNRFHDMFEIEWAINIYKNPLSCLIDNVPENIKEELFLMRTDLTIPIEMGINFWKNICPIKYGASRDLILKIFSMFSTTYICESTFSAMTYIKNKYRSKLTDNHLETLLKIKCYDKDINIDELVDFVNSNK